MCRLQTCLSDPSSQRLLKRNKSLNSRLKEPNSWSTKPFKIKNQRSSRLRVKPKQPNFLVKHYTHLQLSSNWGELKLLVRSQQSCLEAEIESSLRQTLYSWTWLQVWTRISRENQLSLPNPLILPKQDKSKVSESDDHENDPLPPNRSLIGETTETWVFDGWPGETRRKSISTNVTNRQKTYCWELQLLLPFSKQSCFIHYFN